MIRSELKKVRSLLDESIKYRVPDYQRNFEWKRDHAEDFWNDVESGSVFLGTLVLDTANESKGEILVVDGQQRITTIFLLLAACKQLAQKINSSGQASEIQRKISFIDDTSGKASRSKLIPSASIAKIFDKTIASDDWDGKKWDPKLGKLQIRKMRPIYEFFTEKVSSFDKEMLSELLRKLYESTFIRIEVDGMQEALDIFERTNARGMELNEADLVKKYLFEKVSSSGLKEEWDTIVEYSGGNIVRLLKYYYVSHSGGILKKDLFKKLKKHGDDIGATELLKGIKGFAYLYSLITNPSADVILEWAVATNNSYFRKEYNLKALLRTLEGIKLFGVSQGHPLLIKLLTTLGAISDEKQKEKMSDKVLDFFQAIEKFHFVNYAVSQRPGNQIEKYYADQSEIPVTSENIADFMSGIIQVLKKDKLVGQAEFVEKFTEISYENNFTLIYYIFDRLNNVVRPNVVREGGQYISIFNTNTKLSRKNYDIDHLVAQDTSNYNFSEEDVEDYIHGIGNLLVISKHTNGALQHKNIVEKIKVFEKMETQNLVEAKYVVEEWADKRWDSADLAKENIRERAAKLASRAYTECWKL